MFPFLTLSWLVYAFLSRGGFVGYNRYSVTTASFSLSSSCDAAFSEDDTAPQT
jgi:hypothetical protein